MFNPGMITTLDEVSCATEGGYYVRNTQGHWTKRTNLRSVKNIIYQQWSRYLALAMKDIEDHVMVNLREVDGLAMSPKNKTYFTWGGRTYANTWVDSRLQPIKSKYNDLIVEVFEENLCGGDPAQIDYTYHWFASLLQYPGTQIPVALVLATGSGVGKGTILEMLTAALGGRLVAPISADEIKRGWNTQFKDKLLLIWDEYEDSQRIDFTNKFKQWLSNPRLEISERHRSAIEVPNILNHVLTTNNIVSPVRIPSEDRRFAPILGAQKHTPKNARELWQAYVADPDELAAGLSFYLHQQEAIIPTKPIHSTYRTSVVLGSLSPIEQWFAGACVSWGVGQKYTTRELYSNYRLWAKAMNATVYGYQKFGNLLSKLRPHIESYRDGKRGWKKESNPPYANEEFAVDSLQHTPEEQTAEIIDLEDLRQQLHGEKTHAN